MADKSGSPAFRPPMDRITDNDPQILRVPMDKSDWGFRKSQDPKQDHGATPNPRNLSNEG